MDLFVLLVVQVVVVLKELLTSDKWKLSLLAWKVKLLDETRVAVSSFTLNLV